jgi:hypothetical protein
MRNPLNSWEKSDSYYLDLEHFVLGPNDKALAIKLANAGSDHRKFLRQILVSVDILAPLYWWKEFDTYKVGTVANSCSTMHKIHDRAITMNDFSHERLTESSRQLMEAIIDCLNYNRDMFIVTKDKLYWDQMIQLLPTSYNQLRTVTLNYEVLRNIYHSRRHHKLGEWHTLCDWIERLPHRELIV